eukprot:Pompholyxophrys_punicea_v1_NODE_28_length_5163_cov_5.731206.p9 type:complete len:130 gc:universal NODE_28_length_5163_cov_5.731206:649-1038(+)
MVSPWSNSRRGSGPITRGRPIWAMRPMMMTMTKMGQPWLCSRAGAVSVASLATRQWTAPVAMVGQVATSIRESKRGQRLLAGATGATSQGTLKGSAGPKREAVPRQMVLVKEPTSGTTMAGTMTMVSAS